MLMQSHEEVIRVFPCWPKGKNAKFAHLRAYGAFLVSSEIKDNEVQYVEIFSEKGKKLTFENPWSCVEVRKNGEYAGSYCSRRVTFATEAEELFVFRCGK